MLEFGSTWRARVQRRLMKARARCWETCFLRLVSMTSRHWRTISTPSFVAPKIADTPFRAIFIAISLCNFTKLWKNPRWACSTGPTSLPSVMQWCYTVHRCQESYCISGQFLKFSLQVSLTVQYRCGTGRPAFYIPAPISQFSLTIISVTTYS